MFIVNNNRIFALIAYHKQLYQNHQNTFVTRYTNNIWQWRLAWMGLSEVPPSSLVSSIQYIWNPMSEGKPVTCTGWQLVLHKTNIKASEIRSFEKEYSRCLHHAGLHRINGAKRHLLGHLYLAAIWPLFQHCTCTVFGVKDVTNSVTDIAATCFGNGVWYFAYS